MKDLKNILVGVDFNKKTEKLLEKAQNLAKQFNAKLWLLHVATPLPEYIGFESTANYTMADRENFVSEEKEKIALYAKEMKENGVEAEGLLLEGATIDVILEEANLLKVDLIVCGHEEHNLLYNMFFGSISSILVRKSKIPVLVYPLD
jgi:nucleotide-binding universal stress UspA family protein